ncbi:MAG: hypothetical protein M3077_13500, partial [Candidatus Dormibacteraeota bacterium]|nr:hypothetical protein [Candidatus Dormibacteraeota bacterium]
MTSARAQRLIWPVAWLVVATALGDLLLLARNAGGSPLTQLGTSNVALRAGIPVFAMTFVLIGALIASRQPSNPVGWICWGLGIEAAVQALMTEYSWTTARFGPLPGAIEARWLTGALGAALFFLAFAFIILFFPDGHLPSPRWRPAVVGASVLLGIGAVFQLVETAPSGLFPNFHLDSSQAPSSSILGLPAIVLALSALVVKYRRADRERRLQIRWVAFAAALVAVGALVIPLIAATVLPESFVNGPGMEVLFATGTSTIVLLPIAMAVAVLRYRLYDIDLVLNRTLAYGSLAVSITTIYIAIVVGIGSIIGRAGQANFVLSLAATALVAGAFQPLRTRGQRLANRLVYGDRATPYEVLSRFSERIAEAVASDETLAQMARVLAQGTGASRAEVWLRSGSSLSVAAQYPDVFEHPEAIAINGTGPLQIAGADAVVPVNHKGELLGALAVWKRKGESLTPMEQKLMADLAHQAGLALKNVGLAADLRQRLEELRASRERLVTAQDVERRRLERNIHDGAQQ